MEQAGLSTTLFAVGTSKEISILQRFFFVFFLSAFDFPLCTKRRVLQVLLKHSRQFGEKPGPLTK